MKRISSSSDSPPLVARVLLLCATAMALPAQTLTTLHSFAGSPADGEWPFAGLVQATNGDLYGTAYDGGLNSGTLFKVTPGGTLTTVYSFCTQSNCSDGALPAAGLVQATSGDIYGTTTAGGANCVPGGCGTVFKTTPAGALTTLHSFDGTDGSGPLGTLCQATNGNFYGTTLQGGANGPGTVFEITPNGTFGTLHSFCTQPGCADGASPYGGLVQGTDGSLYGTTSAGGTNCSGACGTVFKISPAGKLATIYSFCTQSRCADGQSPYAGLVQGTDGNFYGTTQSGGVNVGTFGGAGAGTVFKITPTGALTTLYSFCTQAGCTDGQTPYAGLVQGTDGDFYGTTYYGGTNPLSYSSPAFGAGTLFKVTPAGTLTTLYNFCSQVGCTDGENPMGELVQDTNGEFYGTTEYGGVVCSPNSVDVGCGTVFSLSVGLGAFVETQTTSGEVGASVKILGTNLKGATRVAFNGTPASFKLVSGSEITATVPPGATTGKVRVVTPGGTLSSSVPFRIT